MIYMMEKSNCILDLYYLVLHKLGVVAIDLHLLDLLLSLLTSQHVTGAQHHDLVLQLPQASLQRADL